jgi:hypothetical protein
MMGNATRKDMSDERAASILRALLALKAALVDCYDSGLSEELEDSCGEDVLKPISEALESFQVDLFCDESSENKKTVKQRYDIVVSLDESAENPCEWGDWKAISFNSKHLSYMHPDKAFEMYGVQLGTGKACVLGYHEHGECEWSLSQKKRKSFDYTPIAGMIIYKGAGKADWSHGENWLDIYNQWCNGDVYYISIKDQQGQLVDSIGGIYSSEAAFGFLQETFWEYTEAIVAASSITGDAAHLLDYLVIKKET